MTTKNTNVRLGIISQDSILIEFRKAPIRDRRQLASVHGVDAANEALSNVINCLERTGTIRRISGKGKRLTFVLASYQ